MLTVLGQYMEEAERYRSDNVEYYGGEWVYVVDGETSDIPTPSRPSSLSVSRLS